MKSMRWLVLVALIGALAGCADAPSNSPATIPAGTPVTAPAGGISREDAAARALEIAAEPVEGIGGPQEPPHDPVAEMMTLSDAYRRMFGQDSSAPGQSGQPVWLVTVSGTWGDQPPLMHHYLILLDAASGALITVAFEP